MDENMMDIVAHDILSYGNYNEGGDEYISHNRIDVRPDLKELTLQSYLKDLKLSEKDYERLF